MVYAVEVSTHTVGVVILRNKPEMFIHSLSKCSFCMSHILFMAPTAYDTINNIVSFTITFHNSVIFPISDRATNSSGLVQFWTVPAIWTKASFISFTFFGGIVPLSVWSDIHGVVT